MTDIELTMQIHRETDHAILVSDDGEKENAVWLPRSQIKIEKEKKGEVVTVSVPEWLAKDKGLI